MKQILIDRFIVPPEAMGEFVQRMNTSRSFLRSLPGFIEEMAYEQTGEDGNVHVVTLAIWESEEAIQKARAAVQAEYSRTGFRPAEMFARLNITLERGTYQEMAGLGGEA